VLLIVRNRRMVVLTMRIFEMRLVHLVARRLLDLTTGALVAVRG
jgi:hypothetical protein